MLIATDPLSLVFIGCFLFGLVFFLITALLGNLGHGLGHYVAPQAGQHVSTFHTATHVGAMHPSTHGPAPTSTHATGTHSSQHAQGNDFSLFSFVNPTSVMLFLLGFGFFGYVFHNTGHFVATLTLALAVVSGIVIAALLLYLLNRLFGDSEGATVQDISDRTGLLGKVSIAIPANGLGEVLYVSPGGMRKSIPARSVDGHRLERDQEVVVVKYERGIAEVDTWEHFINDEEIRSESASDDGLAKLRTLLDESSSTNAELVIRKDLQKE